MGSGADKQIFREYIDGDTVNHPPHYTATGAKCKCGEAIEVIQITRELNFCLGNVVKSVWTMDGKEGCYEDRR